MLAAENAELTRANEVLEASSSRKGKKGKGKSAKVKAESLGSEADALNMAAKKAERHKLINGDLSIYQEATSRCVTLSTHSQHRGGNGRQARNLNHEVSDRVSLA